MSPVLLESYLSAAGRISALAIGDPKTPPMGEVYRVRQDASQSRHVEGLPLGTVGGFAIQRNIPLDGEYEFKVRLFRTNLGTMRGLEFPHQLEITVDGTRVHLAVVRRRQGRARRRATTRRRQAMRSTGGSRVRVPDEGGSA